ncbi:hypothetical protein BaRGS_00014555, partial [Batillaria attramentaria]
SEEPAATNMDISTGHVVLSYMEDHLKNQDRLEQEWEALAAYQADPCSTTVANDPSNTRKNRYTDILPLNVEDSEFRRKVLGHDYVQLQRGDILRDSAGVVEVLEECQQRHSSAIL